MSTDSFQRLIARSIPQTFIRPRVYLAGPSGILVGEGDTTYGYESDGTPGGSRGRTNAELQWGNPAPYAPYSVGRLWTGKTLYSVPTYRALVSSNPLLANATPLALPIASNRYFLQCCMTGDGHHVFVVTAPPSGFSYGGGDGDQWHLLEWNGAALTLVRQGTMESSFNEYWSGPGSTAQIHNSAAMLESDLVTLWQAYASDGSVTVWRIDAAGVLRKIQYFYYNKWPSDGLYDRNGYASVYADAGTCVTVNGSSLTVHTSMPVAAPEVIQVVKGPASSVGLEQVDNGVFDLVFYDPETDDRAVETLVYAVLFTNAEAPVARVPDRYARQGWWLDAEAGSGLWHVRRQPLGSAARREALEMVRAALEDHAPALSGIAVVESARTAGFVSSVFMDITGFYSGRQFLVSVPL
jgi:hypothetical protein